MDEGAKRQDGWRIVRTDGGFEARAKDGQVLRDRQGEQYLWGSRREAEADLAAAIAEGGATR